MDTDNTIYLLGGHKLSFAYFTKLRSAKNIVYKNICLVDPDPHCFALQQPELQHFNTSTLPNFNTSTLQHFPTSTLQHFNTFLNMTYPDFLLEYLDAEKKYPAHDLLIPDHTAKHVLLQAFLQIVAKKFPQLKAELSPITIDFLTPFQNKFENEAIWAVSYATWMCPPDCTEPATCPHINDTRTWDFNKSFLELESAIGKTAHVYRFSCRPLYEEICAIPLAEIATKTQTFRERLENKDLKDSYIITHSHCHGIVGKFSLTGC